MTLGQLKPSCRSLGFAFLLYGIALNDQLRAANPDAQLNLFEQIANRSSAEIAPLTVIQQNDYLQDAQGNQGEPIPKFQPKKLLTFGVGYDSNPGSATNAKGAWLGKPDVNMSLGWTPLESDVFVGQLEASGTIYDGASASMDQAVLTFDLNWTHSFTHDTMASLDAKDVPVFIGGKAAQNKGDFVGSFGRFWATHAWKCTLQLEYANMDQLIKPSKSARNISANLYTIGPVLAYAPADVSLGGAGPIKRFLAQMPFDKVDLDFFHAWNAAAGSDNDYQGNKIVLNLNGLRFGIKRLSANLSYSHEWRNYSHPNSFSSAGLKRTDNIDRASVEFDYNLLIFEEIKPKIFIRYDLTDEDSNIAVKTYRDHLAQIGFSRQL